jgi:NAD(P)-dependent dehydrogenase (short-subunit alcohol dehydrogenase family)
MPTMVPSEGARTALVTGATGAIGQAIVTGLVSAGYEVVLTARDPERGRAALDRLAAAKPRVEPRFELVDLSRPPSIRALARRWQGPLHLLINNAAECPRSRRTTAEGLETQFATNVLAYFLMMREFGSALAASAPARIVNVASYWAGGLDLQDLQFVRRRYDNDDAYRQSKQADRMLTVAFAKRLGPKGVNVNACHPGDVNSKLSNALGFGGHESPEQGADTPLWLATSAAGGEHNGAYFAHQRRERCRFGEDGQAVEALYRECERLVG